MNTSTMRRAVAGAVAAAAVAATVAAAGPATASSMYFSKSSGQMASVSWLEVGQLPPATGVEGNAHFGELWVEDLGRGRAGVWGTVFDVECEDGVEPYIPGWGHHGEEPEEPVDEACVLIGIRWIEGGTLTLTMDKKFNQARLTGTLAVGDGHGGPTAAPPVDITWNGVGSTYTSRESGSYTDQWSTYRYRYTFSGRDAVIGEGSRIGPMIFDDEDGEWSDARLGSYRSASRERTR
jgi:hypothetical protein